MAPVVRRPNPTAVGIAIWLASEVMFFGGLLRLLRHPRPTTTGRPRASTSTRSGLFTLVLVASSFTLHAAEQASHRAARIWTLATLALGVIFLANQAAEWASNDFSVSTNAYGSMYYALTGFHGLHVAVGLVLLAIVGLRDPDAPSSVPGLRQATSWYWHFVDVVWVCLFATIFLIQSGAASRDGRRRVRRVGAGVRRDVATAQTAITNDGADNPELVAAGRALPDGLLVLPRRGRHGLGPGAVVGQGQRGGADFSSAPAACP